VPQIFAFDERGWRYLACLSLHSFASSVREDLGMHSDGESTFFANASAVELV
jgi:hypothetical protein